MIDGKGKRGKEQLAGLTDTMKRAVFEWDSSDTKYKKGDFVLAEVTKASPNALICEPIEHMSIQDYFKIFNNDRHKPYTA